MSSRRLRQFIREKTDWFIGALALLSSFLVLLRVADLGLLKVLTDQHAHLNFARALFDSMTPGISQIGFWPPLLHLLLSPFASVPFLYDAGVAGAFVLIPFFVAGSIFLYRLLLRLTGRRWLSFSGTLLFLFNPYILYYSVTPMMEVLFLSNLLAVAYFIVAWLQEDKLKFLLAAGIFTALAGLSRYEGFALIPVLIAVFALQSFLKRKTRSELQATLIVFLFVAIIGVVAVMGFSWFYSGNPFSFAGGTWIRDPFELIFPTKHDFPDTVNYFLHASYHMIGQPVVILGLASFALLLFFLRKRLDAIAALLVTLSPVALVLFAVYTGSYSISVPEMPPITIFLNERYALTWIGFLVLSPALLAAYILDAASHRRWLHNLSLVTASFLITAVLSFNFGHLYSQAYLKGFEAVAMNSNRPLAGQLEAAEFLGKNYDFGKVLITRADNDPVISQAGLPLNVYIYEGNYLFFDQAVNDPWLFARWVVIHNPEDSKDEWAQANETLSRKWGSSPEFAYYYSLVSENPIRRIYKVSDSRVRALADAEGWNKTQVPSINRNISYWSPNDVYERIKQPSFAQQLPAEKENPGLSFLKMMGLRAIGFFGWLGRDPDPASKESVRESLIGLYEQDLRPDYQRGFFVDGNGEGTSESQSYAMLQSYWTGDKSTFERVWEWTESNLKRQDDNLFSWKFVLQEHPVWEIKRKGAIFVLTRTSKAKIADPNSATDADSDIAYALLKAGEAWGREDYLEAGRRIVSDIYEKETGEAAGRLILTAGNWGDGGDKIYSNPSYFAPYQYRLFQRHDPDHDWNRLIEDNYSLLSQIMLQGPIRQYGLPTNWVAVDKATGAISSFTANPEADNYTYDAFRTFWRIAFDQIQTPSSAGEDLLKASSAFRTLYLSGSDPCTIYQSRTGCRFQANLLAAPLAVFSATDSSLAERMVRQYYVREDTLMIPEDSFFARSWHWFGLALYGAS